ncbi:hypothetical protein [Paenibacillus sp. YYML68]|uniref:hypothetical protein n=1 Tax=Paenibacillus sp. YYML68 TaxID=2909250 RepID=UPI0024932AD8|nr:hypothetical protein [Paenibacillus sp. YYML68]
MYSAWSHQLGQLLHMAFALFMLLLVVPRLIFTRPSGDWVERQLVYSSHIVLYIIACGYILVATKLYEFIAWVLLVLVLSIRKYTRLRKLRLAMAGPDSHSFQYQVLFYNALDGRLALAGLTREWLQRRCRRLAQACFERLQVKRLAGPLLLLSVVGYAAYLRFYDALTEAAPALSDGFVTLAWMKYIDKRQLFFDYIYPQGFHIVLATIQKWAQIDHLYILKYMGPLDGILITLAIWVTVQRLTGSYSGALLAAALYGWFGAELNPGAWERQTATNSQEFAFIFVPLTSYFYYRYVRMRGEDSELSERLAAGTGQHAESLSSGAGEHTGPPIAARIGLKQTQLRWRLKHPSWPGKEAWTSVLVVLCILGLTHALAYAYACAAIAAGLVAGLMVQRVGRLQLVLQTAAVVVISGAAAAIPLGYGLLIGRPLHSTSVEYLVSKVEETTYVTTVNLIHEIAAVSIGVVAMGMLLKLLIRKQSWATMYVPIYLVGFGCASFLLYAYGGELTQSGVVASRSGDLWALTAPICIGSAWHMVWSFVRHYRWATAVSSSVLIMVLAWALLQWQPEKVEPYKMESESSMEQYLRISQQYRPKTWTIVSQTEGGYSLALGIGYHQQLSSFLERYDPSYELLTRQGSARPDPDITHDVFLFHERQSIFVKETNGLYPLLLERRVPFEANNRRLEQWLHQYESLHGKPPVYYEDDHLTVYHFHRDASRKEIFDLLWGPSPTSPVSQTRSTSPTSQTGSSGATGAGSP